MINRLRSFAAGRNGPDMLSGATAALSFAVNMIARITGSVVFRVIAALLMISALFRILSRNVVKRREENYNFVRLIGNLKAAFSSMSARRDRTPDHKFFTCPDCKQRLRIPKGKGKIRITCSRCGNHFYGKT